MRQSIYYRRICNVLLIALLVTAYQGIVTNREKKEEIIKLQSELERAGKTISLVKEQIGSETEDEMQEGAYKDGSYTGEGYGFGGTVAVQVQIEGGKIATITITNAKKEDSAYLTMAEDILEVIQEEQTAEVDTVSGATYTSEGIRDAVKEALEQAEGNHE